MTQTWEYARVRATGLSLLLAVALAGCQIASAVSPPASSSVNSAGVSDSAALSPDGIIRGAWYELAFTQPTTAANPPTSRVERMLVELMDRAQQTMDVAIYDLDLQSVADAIVRAAKRGVRVRMVAESDIVGSKTKRVQDEVAQLRAAGIPIVSDTANHLMHDKFVVVDGRWVETGSWNYTFSETYRNNNNSIVIESTVLAANFTSEFEKMFVQQRFGTAKPRGIPNPTLSLAGARAENYFAPEDRPASHVIAWLGTAKQQIHFLAFSFTHDGIGDAMVERAKAGVAVGGIFEAAGARDQYTEYPKLKSAGLDVLLDANPFNLHHKVMVLDGHVTIFGSFNFSASADRENDENLLIVDDPGLAAAFEGEYQRIRDVALRRN